MDPKEGVQHLNALAGAIQERWGNNNTMLATLMLCEAVAIVALLGMVSYLVAFVGRLVCC